MVVLVVCYDDDTMSDQRKAALLEHRAFVNEHADLIQISGPLVGPDGEARRGQVYVLEVDDVEAAHEFIEGDPFFRVGLFTSVTYDQFLPIIRDGRRLR